ncbi:tryptophanase leader peptide, partial [Photobacterium profundum]
YIEDYKISYYFPSK